VPDSTNQFGDEADRHAFVIVDLQHWFESDKNPAGWAAAVIQL